MEEPPQSVIVKQVLTVPQQLFIHRKEAAVMPRIMLRRGAYKKFQIMDDARNVGGLTLFGSGYGNYNQDIKVHITYSPM